MAVDNPPGWLQNAGAIHTATQMRAYNSSLVAGVLASGSTTRSRGGVHPGLGTALVVTQNGTPNMSVNVGAGLAYIPGTESTSQATYFVHVETVSNLSIATAPGAGLNRIDIVVAKVQDSLYSGVTDTWSLVVVTGSSAASPVAPAAPANSITLASVFVGANVTSIVTGNITDTRFFAGVGGTIDCRSTTRPTGSTLWPGQTIFELDTLLMYMWNGAAYTLVSPNNDPWHTATLANSWVATNDLGTGVGIAYRLTGGPPNSVEIRMAIQSGTTTAGTTITTLPVGYRPVHKHLVPMNSSAGAGRLSVNTNGTLTIDGAVSPLFAGVTIPLDL